jgi:hypothetical protein
MGRGKRKNEAAKCGVKSAKPNETILEREIIKTQQSTRRKPKINFAHLRA